MPYNLRANAQLSQAHDDVGRLLPPRRRVAAGNRGDTDTPACLCIRSPNKSVSCSFSIYGSINALFIVRHSSTNRRQMPLDAAAFA